MQLDDKSIKFLVGDAMILSNMGRVKALPVFDDKVLAFLDALSKSLLGNQALRSRPDVVAFAFWIRKKNLEKLGCGYRESGHILGRGLAFHITPANIPVQFAVSLVYGLLSGNGNVVRLSDHEFEEVNILCAAINQILQMREFEQLRQYICVVRYGHDDSVTEYLSGICDARLIWGGDRTIRAIKRFAPPPRAVELCFADRDSFAVIDADRYLASDTAVLARDFFIDTYYVDQNACSSPRLVVWLGERTEEAKHVFWQALLRETADYELSPVAGSEKLLQFCLFAAGHPDASRITHGNKLIRVELTKLDDDVLDSKSNMGYFFEYTAKSLAEIVPLFRKSCQTVSYYGIDEDQLWRLVQENGVKGVDRIVPLGHTQDLSLIWDGFDVIGSLSRIVSVQKGRDV